MGSRTEKVPVKFGLIAGRHGMRMRMRMRAVGRRDGGRINLGTTVLHASIIRIVVGLK